jgi:hypothetical protein
MDDKRADAYSRSDGEGRPMGTIQWIVLGVAVVMVGLIVLGKFMRMKS